MYVCMYVCIYVYKYVAEWHYPIKDHAGHSFWFLSRQMFPAEGRCWYPTWMYGSWSWMAPVASTWRILSKETRRPRSIHGAQWTVTSDHWVPQRYIKWKGGPMIGRTHPSPKSRCAHEQKTRDRSLAVLRRIEIVHQIMKLGEPIEILLRFWFSGLS